MAACHSCGAQNPDGFRFCGSCGTALGAATCSACGFANPAGLRFCGQCGTPLGAADAPARAVAAAPAVDERKLATVLFADVVGFTSLAERTDAETVARTVDAAFRRMAEVVAEHGGTVDKYMGDSLMALFGVPQAHDDDAERAVAAALAMRDLGGDLAFSIGINTGPVMATAVGRDGEVTVIGDTVNVAARLEKAAGPGEVLVGRLTAELAGEHVAFRERQAVVLKGKRDPVDVWEAVSLRLQPSAAPERTPLVGRDGELAFLCGQWRRVTRSRRAAVVLVTGDAGVGKTRLIEELCRTASEEALVAKARYPAYGGLGGPRVAKEIAEQLGPMGEKDVDVRVASVAGEFDASLRDLGPDAVLQEQVWAFRRYIEEKAADKALLISIDDIHRSGDNTLELLAQLMARVVDVPIMLVLAGRPDPADWLTRFPVATTLRLPPLDPPDARELVDVLAEDGLSDRVASAVVERGGGNPLYLRELVAMAAVKGPEELPPGLHAVLAARLDALKPAEKAAIQRIAVLGDAASEDEIARLGLDDASSALAALVGAGLAQQRGDGCYEVVDTLLREVAYETLPRNVRGEWHRQVADHTSNPVDRARHLDRAASFLPDDAELRTTAARALADAGLELLDAQRADDGIALLRRAVDLGFADAGSILVLGRAMVNAGMDEAIAVVDQIAGELAPAEAVERDHIVASALLLHNDVRAVDMFRHVGERWLDLGDKGKAAWAHSNLGALLFSLGRMHEAAAELKRALALFSEVGDRPGQLAAASFLAIVRPEDADAGRSLDEALHYATAIGDRHAQNNTMVLLAWHHVFRSHLGGRADFADAEEYARKVVRLSVELGMTHWEAHGRCLSALILRLTGRLDEAMEIYEPARQLRLPPDEGPAILVEAVGFSLALAAHGSAPLPRRISSTDPVAWMGWVTVADALLLAGKADDAARWMDLHDRPSLGSLEGLLFDPLQAIRLALSGEIVQAREFLERALATAETIGARPSKIGARAMLAEIAAHEGDVDEARHLLPADEPDDTSVAAALVLRAKAMLGDADAPSRLQGVADLLRAPGLVAKIQEPAP